MTRIRIAHKLHTRLARDAGWMLLSQVGLVALQGIYFVIVARMLGVAGYGLLIAVTALAGIIAPFAMLGMPTVVMREVARSRGLLPAAWGNALAICMGLGSILTIALVLLGSLVLPAQASLLLVACIALADLVVASPHQVHAQMLLADGRARASSLMMLLPVAMRLAGALGCAVLDVRASAAGWSVLYLVAACAATIAGSVVAARTYGRPRVDLSRVRTHVRLGSTYAIGYSSMTIYNDIDKTMLARLDGVASAGAYAAGYRVVGMAMTPIFALLHASFAGFFRHGASGVVAARRYAHRIVPAAAAYGAIAGLVIWVVAPVAPLLFGAGFGDSVDTIRLLAMLPLIKAVQNLLGDVLTGADRAGTRSILQFGIAAVNVSLNLVLIPLWSFRGAAVTTLVCDTMLLCALWCTITVLARSELRAYRQVSQTA